MCNQDRLLPWILTASACISHAVTGGVAFSVGVYYVTFLGVFASGNGATSWIGSLSMGALCAVGPLASYMIDKLGVRTTVIIGGVTSASGLLIASFSPSLLVLFLSLGILTGVGYGLVFTSAVVVIGISLTKYRTLAMGVAISGIGLGNFAYPFLATFLMEAYGWRGALMITSGITLNVCLFGMFMGGKARSAVAESGTDEDDLAQEVKDDVKGSTKIPLINVAHASSLSIASSRKSNESGRFSNSMRNLAKFSRVRPYLTDEERTGSTELLYSVMGRSTSRTNISKSSFTSMQSLGNSQRNLSHSYQRIPCKSVTDSAISLHQRHSNTNIHVGNGSIHDKISLAPIYIKSDDNLNTNDGKSEHLLEGSAEEDNLPNKLYSFSLPSYWLIHANVVLFCLSLSVVLTHAAPYSQYNGFSSSEASILISINGATNVVGRVVLGAITELPMMNTFLLYGSCYLLAGVAVLAMTVWTSFPGLMTCIATFGAFSAAYGPVLAEATLEVVGVENFNYAYGFLMISMALGTTLGAPLAGWLYDLTLQYTSSFYFGGSCLLMSALLMLPLTIARARTSRDQEPPEVGDATEVDV